MILEDKIYIIIDPKVKKHYEDLGYEYKHKTKTLIKVEDLTEGSAYPETRICDVCGKKYTKTHQSWVKSNKSFGMDVCNDCAIHSDYIWKIRQEHSKITNLNKYGVENPMKVKEIIEKCKANGGMTGPKNNSFFNTSEGLIKAKEAFKEKYGTDHPMHTPEIIEKLENTNLEKYGAKCVLSNPEIRNKCNETLSKNGNCKTSFQQLEIYNMLSNYEVSLNSPLSKLTLDILFEDWLDIEYDGWYWHKDRKREDYARDVIVKRNGLKVLRIKSKERIPTKDQLIEAIEILRSTDKKYYEIVLDDWKD